MGLFSGSLDCDCCGFRYWVYSVVLPATGSASPATGLELPATLWNTARDAAWANWSSLLSGGSWQQNGNAHKNTRQTSLHGCWWAPSVVVDVGDSSGTPPYALEYITPTCDVAIVSFELFDMLAGGTRSASCALTVAFWILVIEVEAGKSPTEKLGIDHIDVTAKFTVQITASPSSGPPPVGDSTLHTRQDFPDKYVKHVLWDDVGGHWGTPDMADDTVEGIRAVVGTSGPSGTWGTTPNYAGVIIPGVIQKIIAGDFTEDSTQDLSADSSELTFNVTSGFGDVVPSGRSTFFVALIPKDPTIWSSNPIGDIPVPVAFPGPAPVKVQLLGERIGMGVVIGCKAYTAGGAEIKTLVPSNPATP